MKFQFSQRPMHQKDGGKVRLVLMFFVCCFASVTKLQAQDWVKVTPIFIPPGSQYTYHGYFVDEKHGWWDIGMAGPGSIYHTSNDGITWYKQLDSNEVGCYDLEFTDTLHGWFVGRILPNEIYNILVTKDGGESWSKYLTPTITCITFFDSLNGFAGGGSIYKTTDGGITWGPQEIEPGVRFGIMDIYFVDKGNGWAVGGSSDLWDAGIILNTTDSGKYWKVNEHPSGVYGLGVYFSDSLHGYVVGSNPPIFEGVIQVTNDGGVSWTTHYLPCTWLNDVVFTDDSTGWVVGDYGFIWHTTDRGVNWSLIESGTTSDLYRIFFFDHGKVGYIFGNNSTLLRYDKTVDIKEEKLSSAMSFKLSQNYPNPFNPTTTIRYQLPSASRVSIKIYNILGQQIRNLVDGTEAQGSHTSLWDGRNDHGVAVSGGVYFYRIESRTLDGSQSLGATKKMLLVK